LDRSCVAQPTQTVITSFGMACLNAESHVNEPDDAIESHPPNRQPPTSALPWQRWRFDKEPRRLVERSFALAIEEVLATRLIPGTWREIELRAPQILWRVHAVLLI
jgi:hypothetical protein